MNISRVLSCIEYCEHGDRCNLCCFIYTGPLKKYKTRGLRRVETLAYLPEKLLNIHDREQQKHLLRFAYETVNGFTPTNIQIQRACENFRCVNLHHAITVENFSIEKIFKNIQYCEHGIKCHECCWPWIGTMHCASGRNIFTPKVRTYLPNGKRVGIHIRRYVVENMLKKPVDPKKYAITSCGYYSCVNWHHVIFESKHDRAISIYKRGLAHAS